MMQTAGCRPRSQRCALRDSDSDSDGARPLTRSLSVDCRAALLLLVQAAGAPASVLELLEESARPATEAEIHQVWDEAAEVARYVQYAACNQL
eukprot:COSAG06_NODE_522_length_14708_cov_276.456773_6_plen_93_part_00